MTKAKLCRFAVQGDDGEVYVLAEDTGSECGVDAQDDFGLSWSCSRLRGHVGPHVAATFKEHNGEPEEILWVWTTSTGGT